MTETCLRSKFGFCKFGNRCDKVHFTEVCENHHCKGKDCDKRHPIVCFYFSEYGRCKFGHFCAYGHPVKREQKLVDDVKALQTEVSELKKKVEDLVRKLFEIESAVPEKVIVSENNDDKAEETSETPIEKCETETKFKSLDEVIKENSVKSGKGKEKCDQCEYKSSSETNMKIHKAKEHTNVKLHGGFIYGSVRKDEGGGFECNICEAKIPTHDELVVHLRKEHDYLGENVIKHGFLQCSTSSQHWLSIYRWIFVKGEDP